LVAVSIEAHYDIHYSQNDWAACHRIAIRMGKTSEEISELSRKCQIQLVDNGTHNFITNNPVYELIKNGTHPFLGGEWTKKHNDRMLKDGSHPFSRRGANHHSHDITIYNFENTDTGQKVNMTQSEFVKTFSANQGAISTLCNGKIKSYKKWKIEQ
jgi:hypothetical protein